MDNCKDCVSYDVCQFHIDEETTMTVNECDFFKDKSLYVEIKDCTKCVHFTKHAGQYPCSRCRNLFHDMFEPKGGKNE